MRNIEIKNVMDNNRRNFLKLTGLTGGGLFLSGFGIPQEDDDIAYLPAEPQQFNMAGYGAPPVDKVRVAVIGLGQRGPAHVRNLMRIENVEIRALCDLIPEKAQKTKSLLSGTTHDPELYSGSPEEWKKVCERDDIDLVILTTPWYMHAHQAVYVMEHGKHVASEVPAAATIKECWQLVQTSERTRKHCMMLENYSYGFFQLLTLNMAREGYFGEIVHGDCAYNDNKMRNNFSRNMYWDMWWLKQYASRKGNIYPTHGLGPVCQIMDINSGDRLDYLVSMESDDFQMKKKAEELSKSDPFFIPFAEKNYRGNVNTTTIRTSKGKTIMVQHDATSPRPGTHIHGIYGTEGSCLEYPLPPKISKGTGGFLKEQEYAEVREKYTPHIFRKVGELARNSGHGGGDLIMLWRLIDCLRHGFPLDQSVYDAAAWSAVLPLSEQSVKKRMVVNIPDFTRGNWKSNPRNMDIGLIQTGNTGLK